MKVAKDNFRINSESCVIIGTKIKETLTGSGFNFIRFFKEGFFFLATCKNEVKIFFIYKT